MVHIHPRVCSANAKTAFYYDARGTHYNRFEPHAWFGPTMRGRTSHHFQNFIHNLYHKESL